MSAATCAQHPEVPAIYQCDGCERNLCTECVEESHVLLLCRVCGERALPLGAETPASTRDKKRQEVLTRPYSLGEAMLYPFRGLGLYLYIATVFVLAFFSVVMEFGIGCTRFLLYLGFWSLLIGIQFKIVRSTAEGNNELPDWPDWMDFGERLGDILTYLFIAVLNMGPFLLYLFLGRSQIFTTEPNLLFWAGAAVMAWLGSLLGVMAFGAAGTFGGIHVIRIDLHLRGFFAAGADAVHITNLVYAVGMVIFLATTLLNTIPLLGGIVAGIFTAYWSFTGPHLSGVLFRRHSRTMEGLYD